MKAQAIKTGAVIDVEPIGEYRPDGMRWSTNTKSSVECIYKDEDLDFFDLFDWRAFRREAAKDAMTGMMANADFWQSVWSHNRVNGRCDYPSEIAHFAIACADELIKQLKEDEK